MRWFGLAVLAVACLGALGSSAASAHPSGTYTVDTHTTIMLLNHEVQVRYIADYSEIPSLQWSIIHDADGDGVISRAEVDAFVLEARDTIAGNLVLTVGGDRTELIPVTARATFSLGDLGVETLRIEVLYSGAVKHVGSAEVVFEDGNFGNVSGWRSITVVPGEGAEAEIAANWLEDPSAGLTVVPELWLSIPPKQKSAWFTWDPASGSGGTADFATPPPDLTFDAAPPEGLHGIGQLVRGDLAAGSVALALVIAFVLGLLDGFGPGHGKTVVGSYVAGRETRIADVLAIGGVAAATHAVIAVSAGLLVLQASALFLPDLVQWLSVGAGLTAFAVGSVLVVRRVRRVRGTANGCCETKRAAPARKSNAAIGVLGGLIPCPTAFILLLAAVSVGRLGYGVALAAVFSVGTAVALIAVGVGAVIAKQAAGRIGGNAAPALARIASYVPIASAGVMVVAGVVITQQAMTGPVL